MRPPELSTVPAAPSTQVQVQAYRFGLRRLDSALQNGDPLPPADPHRRTRVGLFVGLGIVALLILASAIWGLVRPQQTIGDAAIVRDRDSGAIYVVHDRRLYPALNLTSALLAAGSATGRTAVKTVDAAVLRGYDRGPLIGIPAAPDSVVSRADLLPARWSACDFGGGSVPVLVGRAVPGQLARDQALLVRGPDRTYLLLTGSARVPVSTDPRVLRALGLDLAQARPVAARLLNAVPELPPVDVPLVPSAGRAPSYDIDGRPIGSVVRVVRAASTDLYLLLDDGVQRITPLMADLVRFTYPASAQIATVTPSEMGSVPTTHSPLPVPALRSAPTLVPSAPVVCASWQGRWTISTHSRLPLPDGVSAVGAVYVPPGRGAVVTAVSGSQSTATRYLITDQGIRYPVPDESVLRTLGLGGTAKPVPSALVALLPLGPALDPARANSTWTTKISSRPNTTPTR
jgi:type VII secretion protein EccB